MATVRLASTTKIASAIHLFAAGKVCLCDCGAGGGGEEEVLGVHSAEQRGEPERLRCRERIDACHPLGQRGLLARRGPRPPLMHGAEEEQYSERELHPRSGVVWAAFAADIGRGRAEERYPCHH